MLIEVLILRRIYQAPELFQLLATFAVVLVIKDVALFAWGAEDLVGPRAPGLSMAVEILGRRIPVYDLLLIVDRPGGARRLWLLLNRTRWGALVRAATQDREMVGALGVDQARLFTSVFFARLRAGRPRRRAADPARARQPRSSTSPSSPTPSSSPSSAAWAASAARSSPPS